ncbi:MAG: stage III sporulation protein AB [Clostridia bacterium]|nr:stage III sporulation protein AB [Clostridia bacterium]
MYKAAGALMIIAAFSFVGYSFCRALGRRCSSLEEFRKLFSLLRSEISLKLTPLEKAFAAIGSQYGNSCFILCADKLPELGAQEALINALKSTASEYMLRGEDIELLSAAAVGLGKCDLKNQLKHLDYAVSLIDNSIVRAKKEREEKSRLFMNGAVLSGVMLTLMLL